MARTKALHPRTTRLYALKYKAFSEAVQRELGVSTAPPEEVVASLLHQLLDGAWSKENWRVTKAAVVWGLQLFHSDRTDLLDRLKATHFKASPSSPKVKKAKPNQSISPQCFLNAWRILEQALVERSRRNYKNALPLLSVLRATLLTGLRSQEWGLSTMKRSDTHPKATLVIQDRLTPDFLIKGLQREIILDRLPEPDFQTIEAAIQSFHGCAHYAVDKVVKRLQKEFADTINILIASQKVSRGIKKTLAKLSMLSFREQFALRAHSSFSGHELGPWILSELLDCAPNGSPPRSLAAKLPPVLVIPSPKSMKARLSRLDREFCEYFSSFLNDATAEHQQPMAR